MRHLSLLSFSLLLAAPAFAVQKLDVRFKSEGRVYHVFQPIEEGKDIDIDAPVTSDDKASTAQLRLRASLQAADASGRATLLYQTTLKGAGDVVLLQSQGAIYVVPATYSNVAECADWTFNLGLWNGQKAFMRIGTGDDMFTFSAATASTKQKCKLHVKPGATGLVAAQMIADDGRPRLFSFKVSPDDRPQFGGVYNVGYDASFPGFAVNGIAALAPRKGTTIKRGDRSLNIYLGRDE